MSDAAPMIEIRQVRKAFGPHQVLRGIDLTLAEGERVALFGPNGAGKTTLIRIISTLSKATTGDVRLGGVDVRKAGDNIRRYLGVVTHAPLLYDNLTAWENLTFYGAMYNVPDLDAPPRQNMSCVAWAYGRDGSNRCAPSRGMVQRLAIPRAILHNPPILLLDEPDTGLDQAAADMLRQVLEDVGDAGRTVLLTTHHLKERAHVG